MSADGEKLLRTWFHALGPGYIEIAVLPSTEIPFARGPAEAAARALSNAPGHNVYFGLHPRKAARGSGHFGTGMKEDVLGQAGIAADLDAHGGPEAKHASIEALWRRPRRDPQDGGIVIQG